MKILVITLLSLKYGEAVVKPLRLSPKYQRFELESEEKLNSWDLLPELASYVNRYMATYKTEKEIRETNLINISVSSNLKVSQKLDEYMSELLQEGKKAKILSFEGIQDKVVLAFAALYRLMHKWRVIVISRLFD